MPQLGLLPLDDRAGPVVGLVVEALRHRGRDAGGLVQQEVDDPEVGHVLLCLVELDAERIGVRVREVDPGADVLDLAPERVAPVVGATTAAAAAAANQQ